MPELSDYAYAVTLDEALTIAIHHLEEVRHASDSTRQRLHLTMASLALKSALLLYADNTKETKTQ